MRSEVQVPLLRVVEEVQPVRVPGRQPLFQSWFDLQPASFEGSDLTFEGLEEISNMEEVRFAVRSMLSTKRSAPCQLSISVTSSQQQKMNVHRRGKWVAAGIKDCFAGRRARERSRQNGPGALDARGWHGYIWRDLLCLRHLRP